jgi:hypothetical protein
MVTLFGAILVLYVRDCTVYVASRLDWIMGCAFWIVWPFRYCVYRFVDYVWLFRYCVHRFVDYVWTFRYYVYRFVDFRIYMYIHNVHVHNIKLYWKVYFTLLL